MGWCARWTDIGRTRANLARLGSLAADLELYTAARVCALVRPLPTPPEFSLSVSFVGKRNYTSAEIKTVLANAITGTYRAWVYRQDDRAADLNIRVFLEHETARVGVRLTRRPLHERGYQLAHLPGTLKPSVAAALVRLAGARPGRRMLDPCCGSGTLLIEATLRGVRACGGDNSEFAVNAARANITAAGLAIPVHQWDARSLPLADATIDCIITNPPWGHQVPVNEDLSSLYRSLLAQMRRVLAPAGRLVLLTLEPGKIDASDLILLGKRKISLFGQRPTILVFTK